MTVTIKDIAVAAGVSYSTVSKALNNSPLVKPNTKNKIIKIADEMGYEPNFAAQRLVKKHSNLIGLAWPTIDRMAHSVLATKINEEITKNKYSMILSIDPIQTSLDIFRRYQVDGVIIFNESNQDLQSISSTLPIVSYGVHNRADFPIVDVNYQKAIFTAVSHLYELHHRDILFIGELTSKDERQREKYHGFIKAMGNFHLPTENLTLNTDGLNWYDGYIAAKELLQTDPLPTAIIGASYEISAGVMRAIREAGLRIPEDISLVSYDNIPQMENTEIPLTSVGVPVDAMAKHIVHTVIQLVQAKEHKHTETSHTLDPILTVRKSCGLRK